MLRRYHRFLEHQSKQACETITHIKAVMEVNNIRIPTALERRTRLIGPQNGYGKPRNRSAKFQARIGKRETTSLAGASPCALAAHTTLSPRLAEPFSQLTGDHLDTTAMLVVVVRHDKNRSDLARVTGWSFTMYG